MPNPLGELILEIEQEERGCRPMINLKQRLEIESNVCAGCNIKTECVFLLEQNGNCVAVCPECLQRLEMFW